MTTLPTRPALVSLALAVSALVAAVAGAPGTPPAEAAEPVPAGGPGAEVMGTVGIHEECTEGVTRRAALRRELAAAESDTERARVVAEHLERSRQRLDALQRRMDHLKSARDNGTLSASAFEARVRPIRAGAHSVERTAAAIETVAVGLSDADLRDAGVNQSSVEELGADANALVVRTGATGVAPAFGPGFYANVETLVRSYNESVDGSRRLGRQLRGEGVDLVVTADEERAVVSFRVDSSGHITDLRAGRRGDATLVMRTDRETVRELAKADDTAAVLRRAVRSDDVQFEGVGTINSVKWAVIDWLAGL